MDDFTYHHSRTRTRTRSRSRDHDHHHPHRHFSLSPSPPSPLIRRPRPRLTLTRSSSSSSSSSNGADDYPYSGAHQRPRPRTLTRAPPPPSRLERWGIWSPSRTRHDSCGPSDHDDEEDERAHHRGRDRRVSFAFRDEARRGRERAAVAVVDRDVAVHSDEERLFRLRVAALETRVRRVSLPPAPPPPPPRAHSPPLRVARAVFRRERCVSEEVEVRGREGRWWDDECDRDGGDGWEHFYEEEGGVRVVRWRRVRRGERRPLGGWRRW